VNQAGTNAQFKGVGTINGQGSTSSCCGPATVHRIRSIRIWQDVGGTITDIYDNGVDQALGGGSIKIQTGGKVESQKRQQPRGSGSAGQRC
jgi:hypothetical protein